MGKVPIKLRDNHLDTNGSRFERTGKTKFSDSSKETPELSLSSDQLGLLEQFGRKTLADFKKESVLVLSSDSHLEERDRNNLAFFAYHALGENKSFRLDTGNLMGVLRFRDKEKTASVQVEVLSRFDHGKNNFFLNYLLSKVFDCALGLESVSADNNSFLDNLLDLVFARRLAEAARVGLFRQYRERRCNDWNFKGRLDLSRHLRENVPLPQGVAYVKREIEHDVPLNQMILLAAKIVKKRKEGLFAQDKDAWDALRQLQTSIPNPGKARDVLRERLCRTPVSHPFFQATYEPLRKTAKMILEEEMWSLFADDGASEVSGVVFDGSWLWENYLWTLLQEYGIEGLVHCDNTRQDNPICPFADARVKWFPDFYVKGKEGVIAVLDAKYKDLAERFKEGEWISDDVHEVLSYMYALKSKNGFLLYPFDSTKNNDNDLFQKVKLSNEGFSEGGYFGVVGLRVPSVDSKDDKQDESDKAYADFCCKMKIAEGEFIGKLNDCLRSNREKEPTP